MELKFEELDTKFVTLIEQPPYKVEDIVALINVAGSKASEFTRDALAAFQEAQDFTSTFTFIKLRVDALKDRKFGAALKDALKKSTNDRLLMAFVDSVGFDKFKLEESVARLDKLLKFKVGTRVLSEAMGVGTIKKLDYFYRRITVDFATKKGHQFSFDAALETLKFPDDNHILMLNKESVNEMLKNRKGDFVIAMVKSFGKLSVQRLEELCIQHGFVKKTEWKSFWSSARAELNKNKCVEIPKTRTDHIVIRAAAEDYGDGWMGAFTANNDPKEILLKVREYHATGKMADMTDEDRAKFEERLEFAIKGARRVNDALYARLACTICEYGFAKPDADTMRRYLMERNRYLAAATLLPAREVLNLISFLMKEGSAEIKQKLFDAMNDMCYAMLCAMIEFFRDDADFRVQVGALLRKPKAPATLITYVVGHRKEFVEWKELPSLVSILAHAIALGEGKQNGETLRMQNVIRRLFADPKWLATVFAELQPVDQILFFERFQASIAWDGSTHHTIVVRMTKIVPELAKHIVKKETAQVIERITSMRSYAERQAEYKKLVETDIPKNTARIEFARSYGDLSENAEYQYAKDEQRALLQKQTLMQKDLNDVKQTDFANVETDSVHPGTRVTIQTAEGEKVYTVLGEWDNDLALNIISYKTKLAENMLFKKPGETFEISDANGNTSIATIIKIEGIDEVVRNWLSAIN